MEVLAENRFTITKSLFYEGMLRVSAEEYGKLAKKAVIFLGAAWLVLTAVTLWQRQSLVYAGIELIVLCLVAVWLYRFVPRNKAKRAFKLLEEKYGSDMERTTRFYKERLEVESLERKTTVLYSEIRQVLYAKRLLVLVAEDKTGILLKLDGFACGSAEKVQQLIENAKEEAVHCGSI